MKIHQDLHNFNARNPIVTIGTFDGVHLGHHRVISKLKEFAKKYNGETVIFTFYPHPRLVTSPGETNLRLLTTLEEKRQLLARLGVDHLIIYPFTKEFSQLSYADFVKTVLVDQIKTKCLVVGYDHKFGHNREGGYEYLKTYVKKHKFILEKLDALLLDNIHVSSTKIREALQAGNIALANRYLGYRFSLSGKVIEGVRLGRKIGFPTANIEAFDIHKLIPGYGVYAVKIVVNGKNYKGMLNIGTRPTFNQNADKRSIEVNIFDFEGDIYQKKITLFFVAKIRNEQKFNGVEALVRQLKKDKLTALVLLNR
ncbi:MAG: bifunctional riboflavin kinase/FAD synthetase [Prolixibacteraceae bacterium]|nr:bifunctional riboflavin kinase/FAD synthetase [Prolixibacteraceae bacterium]